MNTRWYTEMPSPIGALLLTATSRGLSGVHMQETRHGTKTIEPSWVRDDERLAPVRRQLEEYFARERTRFDVDLDLRGTPFQTSVWRALCEIPFGQTENYGKLAARVGNRKASRAVGLANGRNPVAIIVPCHRVIGVDGSLTGYGGGVERKRFLLDHEAAEVLTPVARRP